MRGEFSEIAVASGAARASPIDPAGASIDPPPAPIDPPLPPPPIDEPARLAILAAHDPDGLRDDPELAAITAFAAQLCDMPTAMVSLVEAEHHHFLAPFGVEVVRVPRADGFCQHAMELSAVMEVEDALLDPRFADHPMVVGDPNIRFYAGAALVSDEGAQLGALCLLSPVARPGGLSKLQQAGLAVLARAVMMRLNERRASRSSHARLAASELRFAGLSDAIPQMAWSALPDGQLDYFNARWDDFTGARPGEHHGSGWLDALHPDDRALATRAWLGAVERREPYEVEYRLRRSDGEYRWTLARGLPSLDEAGEVVRWFGTNTDIDDYRQLAESQKLLGRELAHRIKNILALVGGLIVAESRADPVLAARTDGLLQRIAALGRAHDYVSPADHRQERGHAGLHHLLGELFAPYRDAAGERVRVTGEDLEIADEAVTPLALLFHELATNATKYGALSLPGGRVELGIARDGEQLRFDWRETGGPKGQGEPQRNGFGSQLMSISVERQLRGQIARRWGEGGLAMTIELPLTRLEKKPDRR